MEIANDSGTYTSNHMQYVHGKAIIYSRNVCIGRSVTKVMWIRQDGNDTKHLGNKILCIHTLYFNTCVCTRFYDVYESFFFTHFFHIQYYFFFVIWELFCKILLSFKPWFIFVLILVIISIQNKRIYLIQISKSYSLFWQSI